jgi:hypothetical protein
MESTPPDSGARPNKAVTAHELLQATTGLMGRIDQVPAFVKYCVNSKREFNNKRSPAYWAAVSDFARDNRGMFEQSFTKRGASLAQVLFATPNFIYAQRSVSAYRQGVERMDYMTYQSHMEQLHEYSNLLRRAMLEHPTQRPALLRNHLHAAAHIAGVNSPDAEYDVDARLRGVLAEVDFETLTARFDDITAERGDEDDDRVGTDYKLRFRGQSDDQPDRVMNVDVKAGTRSLRTALDDVLVLSHVERPENEYAVIRYARGSVNVLVQPYKFRRDDYPFQLPEDVMGTYAPALHDAMIEAAAFPGACQEVA